MEININHQVKTGVFKVFQIRALIILVELQSRVTMMTFLDKIPQQNLPT